MTNHLEVLANPALLKTKRKDRFDTWVEEVKMNLEISRTLDRNELSFLRNRYNAGAQAVDVFI